MLKKSIYSILRAISLGIAASSLPLGFYYFFNYGPGVFGPALFTISAFTICLVWVMIFVVALQETYPTTLLGGVFAAGGAIVQLVYFIITHPHEWLFSFYTSLLISFAVLIVSGLVLWLYTIPKHTTSINRVPWWGNVLAIGVLALGSYLTALFARPFFYELRTVGSSVQQLITLVIFVLAIGNAAWPFLKMLIFENASDRYTTRPVVSEGWRLAAVIIALLAIVVTLFMKLIKFPV